MITVTVTLALFPIVAHIPFQIREHIPALDKRHHKINGIIIFKALQKIYHKGMIDCVQYTLFMERLGHLMFFNDCFFKQYFEHHMLFR